MAVIASYKVTITQARTSGSSALYGRPASSAPWMRRWVRSSRAISSLRSSGPAKNSRLPLSMVCSMRRQGCAR